MKRKSPPHPTDKTDKTLLKQSTCPNLLGTGTIDYEIATSKSDGIQLRLVGNSGNGHYCRGCAMKARCCPNTKHRKIARSLFEKSGALAREISSSEEYFRTSFHERKKVEMKFAHMKRHLNFDRLRLRGIKSANDEFLLVATA